MVVSSAPLSRLPPEACARFAHQGPIDGGRLCPQNHA